MELNAIKQEQWPELAFENWKDTIATLHLWTQIVGKIRLKQTPWLNHSWHVTLYVSASGLTTGSIPYPDGVFQIDFDFAAFRKSVDVPAQCGGQARDLDQRRMQEIREGTNLP